jgi:hypothetical protein
MKRLRGQTVYPLPKTNNFAASFPRGMYLIMRARSGSRPGCAKPRGTGTRRHRGGQPAGTRRQSARQASTAPE